MLLSQYLSITQSLIQTPQSPIPLLTAPLLTTYINIARGQVAGQGECVPAVGQASVGPSGSPVAVPVSDIIFPEATIAGPINLRMIWLPGGPRLYPREWPWFNTFVLTQPTYPSGPPKIWSQYRQGSGGIFYLNPLAANYTIEVDAICYPIDLVDDTTPDVLPYLWTDAVPFYAAYYAYMAMQRQADADHMLQRFEQLMVRARASVTPQVQPGSYPQGPDPMLTNRLGVAPAPRGRGAGPMAG